jgi:predicted aspartyl protease/serine/threonine protein kinase
MENPHSDLRVNPTEAELDKELHDYLIIRQLEVDAFGCRYQARHKKVHRVVSLRVLPVRCDHFAGGVAEFSNRMAGVAQLTHPHLAEVSDFGVTGGGFLYIASNPAETPLEASNATPAGIRTAFVQLLSAVSYLHSHGFSHGAIQPGALSTDPSRGIRLDGLGLSAIAEGLGRAFDSSGLLPFLAPEHARSFGASPPGDAYALGVCLYSILTRKLPQGFFELPSKLNSELGRDFDEIIIGALKPAPEDRIGLDTFASWLKPNEKGSPKIQVRSRPVVAAAPAPIGTVAPRPSGSTSPGNAALKDPKSADRSGFPWLFVAATIASVILIGVLIAAVFTEETEEKAPPPVVEIPPTEPESSGEEPDHEHLRKLSDLLVDLRNLYPHCPNLWPSFERDEFLDLLLRGATELETIIVETQSRPEVAEFLMSEELMGRVSDLHESARLPAPVRPTASGSLVAWTATPGSLKGIKEMIASFEGTADGIVALSGSVERGIGLALDGTLVSWGEGTKPPQGMRDLRQIDSEEGNCIALSGDGRARAWGPASAPSGEVSNWSNLAKVSAGRAHFLGLTEDFRVLAACANDSGQTAIPAPVEKSLIVAIEVVGDFSYAIAADGRCFRWGGGTAGKTLEIFQPREIHSTGTDLYARDTGGDIYQIDRFGDKSRPDLGLDSVEEFRARTSPDGSLLAFNTGKSHWYLKFAGEKTIDDAYFQQVSQGGIDLILGDDRFIGIVPRVGIAPGGASADPAASVRMTSVEGIPVPETLAFRDWSLGQGTTRRARLVEKSGEKTFILEFPDRSRTSSDGSWFSKEDLEFATRWKPAEEIRRNRLREHLAAIPEGRLLEAAGYVRMPMENLSGDFIIPVEIDDREAKLLIDTGATQTVVSTKIADGAGIVLSEGPSFLTWQGRIKAYAGKVGQFRIGSGPILADVGISAMEKRVDQADGLLGIDLIRKFGAVMDFGEDQLYLENGAPGKAQQPPSSFTSAVRTWTSTSKTSTRARYLGEPPGKNTVSLEKEDGSRIEVATIDLSEPDREYLVLLSEHLRFQAESRRTAEELNLFQFMDRLDVGWDEIPVSMSRSTPVVEVLLNGRKLKFFIDTGAADTMLSIETARLVGKDPDSLPMVGRVSGLEGRSLPVRAADFTSFQFGERVLHDYRLLVYDFTNMTDNRFSGSPYDGVIGTDVLVELGAVYHIRENRLRVPVR